ncbi:hypothetical protein MNV49_002158 [Pseudohyphozyma bogoriensis]|nr:hypothetical protein MNV49_002158 [Pseudohyphozyma bogoriensis]
MATSSARTALTRTRPLPVRKSLVYEQHLALLTASPLLLFLRPTDFTAHEYKSLRSSLPPGFSLTHLRPGLLPAVLRHPAVASAALPTSHLDSASHLKGPLALVSGDQGTPLHPPTLKKLLAVLQTFSHSPSRNDPPVDAKAPAPEKKERLDLLSAVVDGRAMGKAETGKVGDLPELDVLRAQIVGLLSMPGSRIVGVLGQRGGEVGRALEGFKKGLEGGEASV